MELEFGARLEDARRYMSGLWKEERTPQPETINSRTLRKPT